MKEYDQIMEKAIELWIKQAKHDLEMAEKSISIQGFDVCAFLSQQAVEKYLKALYLKTKNELPPKTHLLDVLGEKLNLPKEIMDDLYELTEDYFSSRYPDILDQVPYEAYDKELAEEKLKTAKIVVNWIIKKL